MGDSDILRSQGLRTERFAANHSLSELLSRLSVLLTPAQSTLSEPFEACERPVVVVIGVPRSGTTLATQILAGSGAFAYPSNLMSRLAFAPGIGAMLQELIFNERFDLGGEFSSLRHETEYRSELGKTTGPLGVSEFFHFWRRFFPVHDPGWLNDDELDLVDVAGMRRELAAIESVFRRPFVSKGMMLQFNLDFYAERVPEFFFVHVRRDPLSVMRSIALARRKFYRDDSVWWSVRPRQCDFLRKLTFHEQVAGQVYFTERAINDGLAGIEECRFLQVDYTDICASPIDLVSEVVEKTKTAVQGDSGKTPSEFAESGQNGLAHTESRMLEIAYDRFVSQDAQGVAFK